MERVKEAVGQFEAPLEQQLGEALHNRLARVVDLFRAWDEDRSGTIDKKEFWLALCSRGLDVPRHAANALFDEFDADRSGSIDYKELNKLLRRGVAPI